MSDGLMMVLASDGLPRSEAEVSGQKLYNRDRFGGTGKAFREVIYPYAQSFGVRNFEFLKDRKLELGDEEGAVFEITLPQPSKVIKGLKNQGFIS